MYIYHALINVLSTHMIHINLNMIFYTHVEHSPTKTIYIKYYVEKQTHALHTHTHTHTLLQCVKLAWFGRFWKVKIMEKKTPPQPTHHITHPKVIVCLFVCLFVVVLRCSFSKLFICLSDFTTERCWWSCADLLYCQGCWHVSLTVWQCCICLTDRETCRSCADLLHGLSRMLTRITDCVAVL